MQRFVVIENTPGYLPDDDDPPTFDEYAEAVSYLNERAAEYEAEGLRIEYGIASADNLSACKVWDDSKTHDLGRSIEILNDETDEAPDEAPRPVCDKCGHWDLYEAPTENVLCGHCGLMQGPISSGADYRARLAAGADIAKGSALLEARLMASAARV